MLFFAAPAKKQITLTMSAVVLDLGARLIKVGFAGDAHPSHIYSGNINSSLSDVALRSALRSMFFERLVINPRDRRVVVCENLLWPSSFRTALLHALFALEVPAVKFIPVLALPVYALSPLQSSAATTNNPNQIDCSGLVIDIADSETRVMPICDGFAQTELLTVAPVGVGAVVDRLQSLVAADAPTSVTLTSPQWSDAAARFCFVRPSKDFDLSSVASASISADSSNQISARARALACEALFDTDDEFSIAEVVLKCLLKCGPDVRAAVAKRLIVCGGGGQFLGLKTRLLAEMRLLVSRSCFESLGGLVEHFQFLNSDAFNPVSRAWSGGSIFASISDEGFTAREQSS